MERFNEILPFGDSEIPQVLFHLKENETMLGLLRLAFSTLSVQEGLEQLLQCKSISDFQKRIMYPIIRNISQKTARDLTEEGFEKLDKNQSYLFISNHRDIILDTSFLNVLLYEKGFEMTASAIGDNLVQKPFLKALAKLNRNFLIHRGLPPRQMLEKSKIVSNIIHYYICEQNRSVWIAQREGRTKDGNDFTQQGVLKMLTMHNPENKSVISLLKSLKIVPMAISYEFDPTDVLKIPSLIAKDKGEAYVKQENEDFNNIVQGFLGQKGRIHLAVSTPLDMELDEIENDFSHPNQQIQALAKLLDTRIHRQYKLWPANYIAYDTLYSTRKYADFYTEKDVNQFERRIFNRKLNNISRKKFLEMYANPVKSKEKE